MAFPSNPAYATPTYPGVPITADVLATMSPSAVRTLWKQGFDTFETTEDFWADMEGDSEESIIHISTDLSAGRGSQILFTIASALFGEPHLGSANFLTSAHFEQLRVSTNSLWADFIRHAIRFDRRTQEVMGMPGLATYLDELQQKIPTSLGSWAGRLKSEQLFMMFTKILPGDNTITSAQPLGWDYVVSLGYTLQQFGAKPAMTAYVGTGKNRQLVKKWLLVVDNNAVSSIENDSTFKAAVRDTRDPEGYTYLWTGGWPNMRNVAVRVYEGIWHDGYGPQGSILKPLGLLGSAITITSTTYNTALNIIMGGSDWDPQDILVKPTKYFPNYPYQWGPGTLTVTGGQPSILAAGTYTFWVAIVNPSNALTDPGKFGLYQCVANNGVMLSVTACLVDGSTVAAHASGAGPALTTSFQTTNGSANNGSQGADSIGTGALTGPYSIVNSVAVGGIKGYPSTASTSPGLTWGAGNSNTHPVGASIYLVGPDAVPLFTSLMVSADCARRGYGAFRGQRVPDEKEGGFVQERYFMTVMGQNIRTNRIGRFPGGLSILHPGMIVNTPLPS